MPAAKTVSNKNEYVYSDDSFDEDSYQSDSDLKNNRRGKKRKNSQLSFLPSNFKDEALQQWCHEQITKRKNLQNKLGEATKRLQDLLEENRDLRKQVRLSEKSLQKVEKDQKNVPFLLREHSADVRRLKRNAEDEAKNREDLERRNKKMSDELIRLRDENRELKRVINDKDLNKKQLDMKLMEESQSKLEEAEKRNEENERMLELVQKNHKSETQRLNHRVRALQLEKDDLEKSIQDLDLKLQEKDKELAIHYIYAQRLTKPPSRLVNTPPKGAMVNRQMMTDSDKVVEKLTNDNLLLQQEINHLRSQLQSYGATAEYLDTEKEKLEQDQRERAEKERQFKQEMEKARLEAEREAQNRREELEMEAERERKEREEEAERRRVEEQERIERERVEWETTQRKKLEEEIIREIKTHYQTRLQQVDVQILSQLKEKKKEEASRSKLATGAAAAGGGGLVPQTTGRERPPVAPSNVPATGANNCQHHLPHQSSQPASHKAISCQRCQRREAAAGGKGKEGSPLKQDGGRASFRGLPPGETATAADSEAATKRAGKGRRGEETGSVATIEEH